MYRLQDEGILTRNNKPFTSGNLYEILKRKIYIGKIEHKRQVYDGIHEPIIDVDIFNQVQELLANNCNSHKRRYKGDDRTSECRVAHGCARTTRKQPSLLASKLYDDNDFIMSPSHAVKSGKRYRYYISQAYLKKRKELAGSLPQVPATEFEQISSDLIKKKLEELLKFENYSIEQYELYKSNLENYLESWNFKDTMSEVSERTGRAMVRTQNKETHLIVRAIIHKIVISHINIIYYLNPKSLQELFELIITKQEVSSYEINEIADNDCEIIILPCELKRVNQGKTLVIGDSKNSTKNEGVIKLLKQAWQTQCTSCACLHSPRRVGRKWSECIENNMTIKEISEIEKVSTNYIGKILKLRFLSPKIQKMILLGEQSEKLTSHNLRLVTSTDFKEQERFLGI